MGSASDPISIGSEQRTTAIPYAAHAPVNATFVLAHGAGAGQKSAFIVGFARGLAARGIDVLTFNFLYTEQRRRVPDRTDKLETSYRAAIAAAREHFGRSAVFIGGKSMGGRIATHLAAADDAERLGIAGVVLLGYPLHPPGRPEQLRAAHLPQIRVPVLIVQGERDPFGTPGELQPILRTMSARVTLHVVEKGDHSLAPSRRAEAIASTYGALQDLIAQWLSSNGTHSG
jgi:hypothetical protein